ncbi:MAG: ABC transporter substrate-binding protein [Acetobacteraceae bacterium]|nr:ABC transporter substrate-binding protein [Acetobacteraceae bacterium]
MANSIITRRRAAALAASASATAFLGGSQARGAQDPIRIGQVANLTGAAADSGRIAANGAKLALDDVNANGGALGRRLELVVEDSQSSNPGAVLAFSRLTSRGDIVAFLSGTASTQTHALAPDALKAGKPVIMVFATDPNLTHMGHPWLLRCRPNDSYSARVIAEFGAKDLGKQKWAIVHSTDAFGTAGLKALTEALDGLSLKPVLIQGYTNQQADYMPVALAVKRSDADVLASYNTFDNDVALLARQMRQTGVTLPWIGSPVIASTSTLRLAGNALFGTYAVADFAADASPEARAFTERYERAYNKPPDFFAATTFDSVRLLARAINAAQSTEPEPVRKAILSIKGFRGAEGEYSFDANGDGLHCYNVIKNADGKIAFIRHVEFQEST